MTLLVDAIESGLRFGQVFSPVDLVQLSPYNDRQFAIL